MTRITIADERLLLAAWLRARIAGDTWEAERLERLLRAPLVVAS